MPERLETVLLIPLMSWIAPANRGDLLFLGPSLRYLHKRMDFTPKYVVADMAYINMSLQRKLREEMDVGVITRLPPNYDLPKEVEPALLMQCHQGQKLQWLGLRENERLHWFGVAEEETALCQRCWERSSCPREFSFAPDSHEIALGSIPLSTRLGQKLLRQSRTWIEATQSYEKIQLGLGSMFLNSLRLTAIMSQLADTVMLLRAHAYLRAPQERPLLEEMMPKQLNFGFE
jgi:hypothetical protein